MTRRAKPADLKENTMALLETINAERAGQAMLLDGATQRWGDDRVIRSGSISLDMAIGIGGWPTRRLVEIYGEESSGKTTVALHAVREAQATGKWTAFIDAEYALDPVWASAIGVDLNSFIICQPRHLEAAIDLMDTTMRMAMENEMNGGLIVVDSVPALSPMDVVNNGAEKETRALAARRWSTHLPKLVQTAAEANVTLMLINQTRSTMATQPWEKKSDTSGGKAIKFYASVRAKVTRKVEGKGDDEGMVFQETYIKLEKNKVGSPYKLAEARIYPPDPETGEAGIFWEADVFANAVAHGLIVEDEFYEEKRDEMVSRKGWYHLSLSENAVNLIRENEPDFPAGDKNAVVYEDGTGYVQVYQRGKFFDRISGWTMLLEMIEEKILDTLNAGDSLHTDEVSDDELADEELREKYDGAQDDEPGDGDEAEQGKD